MREWIEKNSEVFERDVFRDFCLASIGLEEQFRRFSENGMVSFSIIQALVGEPLNKGLLWRLKDTAHHVFLAPELQVPEGPLLDWTLGYIFHESLKLMEDAHQKQYYTQRVAGNADVQRDSPLGELMSELAQIQRQTRESMGREVERLRKLLCLSRKLFCLYFEGRADHKPLARFLNDNSDLVSRSFGEDYHKLLYAVYGDHPERMYIEASRSLKESGRFEAAFKAVEAALACRPGNPDALELKAALS